MHLGNARSVHLAKIVAPAKIAHLVKIVGRVKIAHLETSEKDLPVSRANFLPTAMIAANVPPTRIARTLRSPVW